MPLCYCAPELKSNSTYSLSSIFSSGRSPLNAQFEELHFGKLIITLERTRKMHDKCAYAVGFQFRCTVTK